MTEDHEDISLKILRVLYQYHKQDQSSGLSESSLVDRFEFLELDDGKKKIRKVLSELVKLELVTKDIEKGNGVPIEYTITEQGIRHYEKFKFMTDEDIVNQPATDINVQGDWHGDSHHHHVYNNHHYISGGTVTFPGETEEFIHHYDELLKEITEIEKLVLDVPTGKEALERLDRLKTIINLDSSAFGGKLKWGERLEEAIRSFEEKVKKN